MRPFYPAGRFECEVTSQGFVKAKTGNIQFVLRFLVKGAIDPADAANYFPVATSYERTYYRVITDKTVEYFSNDMESLGVEFANFTDLDPTNPNHISLAGRNIEMFCSHEPGLDGDLREKWSVVRKVDSKPVESIGSNEVKVLDRLFGKHLKNKPAVAARAPKPSTPSDLGTDDDDDDVPF